MAELQHVYHRDLNPLNPEAQDSLAKIARLIAPRSRVLDVGCGPGVLGEYLTRARNCTVDGVELGEEAARIARRSYRKVEIADLDTFDFETLGEEYDYIVCADVLEHLKDPGTIAKRLMKRLATNGRLLISIPNVGYAGLVAGLLKGEFHYTEEGLLDATHLRFFTRKSLLEFLTSAGLAPLAIDTVHMELSDSEFNQVGLEGFAPALREQLLSSEDALTYQFIVQAAPVAAEQRPAEVIPTRPDPAVTFLCKMFWSADDSNYSEDRGTFRRGRLGVDPQRMRFPLPPLATRNVSLRFDIADRPGYVRLYDMAVYDADGACIWKWDPAREPMGKARSNELTFIEDDQRGQLMVSLGIDPWFIVPFRPHSPQALARGGYIEVDMSWPTSTDSLAVAKQLSTGGTRKWLDRIEREKNELLEELNDSRREQRRLFVERAQLAEARAVEERTRLDLQREVTRAHGEIATLRTLLEQVNNSITFRAAQPVFAVVNRLRARGKDKK